MKSWAMVAMLVAAIGSTPTIRAAEPQNGNEKPQKAPWYKRIFGGGVEEKKQEPKKPVDPAQQALEIRSAAEADLFRRQAVCDELRQIAFENKDDGLAERADDLERRAIALYKKQTADLPCSRLVPSQDERALDRQLTRTPTTKMDAAEKLIPPIVSNPNRRAQANAIREIKP